MAFRIGQPDVATPQELSKHVCIVDTNRVDFTRWRFYKDGAECIYHPSRHLLVNSARVARDWALNGRGIALCPSFVLQKDIEDGRLIQLLGDYTMKTHPLCAVYLPGHVMLRKVRALILPWKTFATACEEVGTG